MLVHIVENGDYDKEIAGTYVKMYVDELLGKSKDIDTILLACTHYPLLMAKIKQHLPANVNVVAQGDIVAASLAEYLQRHPEMESRISREGTMRFFTTESPADFDEHATIFFGKEVRSEHLQL